MKRINIHPETFPISIHDSMKVNNLLSPRTNKPVANQFAIRVGGWLVKFQSYNTTCLTYDCITRTLTIYPEAFGYSRTTSKYSKQFLRDELNLSESAIVEVYRMAKTEDFGRDCPLYIEF